MEQIKCLDVPSWKPTYMKFFSVVVIILTVVGILSQPSFEMSSAAVAVGVPLNLVMIYAVYTYIRDLEHQFKSCQISQTELNIHEFLKFYSLIMVLLVVLAGVAVLGIAMSFIPFPKYVGIQTQINNARQVINQKLVNYKLPTSKTSIRKRK
jgi:choline-glycine betaine transporter